MMEGNLRRLYDTYSGKDDHKSKDRLDLMTEEYFKRDAADLLA